MPLALAYTAEVDLDSQQRRRIKARLGEQLAVLRPYESEVQRHMGQLQSQLGSIAAGLGSSGEGLG